MLYETSGRSHIRVTDVSHQRWPKVTIRDSSTVKTDKVYVCSENIITILQFYEFHGFTSNQGGESQWWILCKSFTCHVLSHLGPTTILWGRYYYDFHPQNVQLRHSRLKINISLKSPLVSMLGFKSIETGSKVFQHKTTCVFLRLIKAWIKRNKKYKSNNINLLFDILYTRNNFLKFYIYSL